jgi:flagellin-like hook-associated protein FlgL
MAFRINTNVMTLNAHQIGAANNREIGGSLEKLSSGLRINKAADDASGLAIADSLRSQANSLGQAIKNANDGVGIIQTADKAMDEQVKILDTIKTKATQAAQDGQTEKSRKAIQQDIVKLMDEMDNIAQTTSFNGQSLLSGQFTDKEFQIGAYSNETITANIGATSSDKIGHTRFETSQKITASANVAMKFLDVDGIHDVQLESVKISTSAGTGLGVLTETINKNSDKTGVRASWTVQTTGSTAIGEGDIDNFEINGIAIGNIQDIKANDKDGKLVSAINALTDKHGVIASVDERGQLNLSSVDGRGIKISHEGGMTGGSPAGSTTTSTIGIKSWNAGLNNGDFNITANPSGGTITSGFEMTITNNGTGTSQTFTTTSDMTVGGAGNAFETWVDSSLGSFVGGAAAWNTQIRTGSPIFMKGPNGSYDITFTSNDTELNTVLGIDGSTAGASGTTIASPYASSTVNTPATPSVSVLGMSTEDFENYGRLTLTRSDARDIIVSGAMYNDAGSVQVGTAVSKVGFGMTISGAKMESEATINLRAVKGGFTVDQASAMGVFANSNVSILSAAKAGMYGNTGINGVGIGAGVTTLGGAMATMSIADSAIKDLDKIRSDLGSTQNQLITTINNISVTQVNVKAAESQIRDVDFAEESANFQKLNILAQAGSYAMSQANQQAQSVTKMLQ